MATTAGRAIMSQHDVLNPNPAWEENLQDTMCPNFGFTRKRPLTHALQKAVGAAFRTRASWATRGMPSAVRGSSRRRACARRRSGSTSGSEDRLFRGHRHDGGGDSSSAGSPPSDTPTRRGTACGYAERGIRRDTACRCSLSDGWNTMRWRRGAVPRQRLGNAEACGAGRRGPPARSVGEAAKRDIRTDSG